MSLGGRKRATSGEDLRKSCLSYHVSSAAASLTNRELCLVAIIAVAEPPQNVRATEGHKDVMSQRKTKNTKYKTAPHGPTPHQFL
jgi:hypothetical protein